MSKSIFAHLTPRPLDRTPLHGPSPGARRGRPLPGARTYLVEAPPRKQNRVVFAFRKSMTGIGRHRFTRNENGTTFFVNL